MMMMICWMGYNVGRWLGCGEGTAQGLRRSANDNVRYDIKHSEGGNSARQEVHI